jgi:hypothetical protein
MGGDGEDRSDLNSSDELDELSPTRAGGSLSGIASAEVICTGDSDNRSVELMAPSLPGPCGATNLLPGLLTTWESANGSFASSSGDDSTSNASLCFARLILVGFDSSGELVVFRSLLEMLSVARARSDDDFSRVFSLVAGEPDRGVDSADEVVDIDSALGFFCAAFGAGDRVPFGGLLFGGAFCSLPLLPLRWRLLSAVPGRSIGEASSEENEGDSRRVSPDSLPLILLASSPALPFFSLRLNSPLSMPGFFSFLLPLLGLGSFSSKSRLGPLSSEVLPFDDGLFESVSRKMFGVSVIFLVSMLSSRKKESVLRGVPLRDCF